MGALYASQGSTIFNNTFFGNSGQRSAVELASSSAFVNNIVAFSTTGIASTPVDAPVIRHNLFYGNTIADVSGIPNPVGQDGNILQDPLFLDSETGDFHLKPGSPAIDAGDDAAVADGDIDLDGNPRRQGSHVDIGAYESQPAGFTMADARSTLLCLSGLAPTLETDITRLDIVKDEASAGVLDIRDAVLLARKASRLDTYP